MRCLNCRGFALLIFCDDCVRQLGEWSPGLRILEGDFRVYSFYKYADISQLLHLKHNFYGYFAFKMLARLSFAKFHQLLGPQILGEAGGKISAIPLDDRVEGLLYSHSAILAHALKSPLIRPQFATLHAASRVRYTGQSLEFRQRHRRRFKILKPIKTPLILVDDVITTGLSITEAQQTLQSQGAEVLFGLVLADARG